MCDHHIWDSLSLNWVKFMTTNVSGESLIDIGFDTAAIKHRNRKFRLTNVEKAANFNWVLDSKDLLASVVTSKPANGGHRKSGQWGWPGTVLFYPFEPVPGKPVLVRQLRGPHLRT